MDASRFLKEGQTEAVVGFFDLTRYAEWSKGRPPADMLELATALFDRTGRAVTDGGGLLVKAIGDAGLFLFPADDPDRAVSALRALKTDIDAWLWDIGYPGVLGVMVQLGPVAFGLVGAPDDKRFDVYGETVNRAALMSRGGFVIGTAFHDRLPPATRQHFSQTSPDEFALSE